MLECYTDCLSAYPGERVRLYGSGQGRGMVSLTRVGRVREEVLSAPVELSVQEVPAHADRDGCDWPVILEIEIGSDWRSGYYDITLTDEGGAQTHHFVCVKATGAARNRTVLVLAAHT